MAPSKPHSHFVEYDPPLVREDPTQPFTYIVESRSGGEDYRVDLTDRNGHGGCDCRDFLVRASPNLRRHGKFIPYAPGREGRTECCHIRAAFEHFHQFVTQPMLAKLHAGLPNHQPTRKNP